MGKLSENVTLRCIAIFCGCLFSCVCAAHLTKDRSDIDTLKGADHIVFGAKVGGEVSCGHYQLWIHEFGKGSDLSCKNDSVLRSIEALNQSKEKESFIVLWSIYGDLDNASVVDIKNRSASGFEYGEKYLLFVDESGGELYVFECGFFNRSFYEKIVNDTKEVTRNDVIKYIIDHGSCRYVSE